MDDVKVIWSLSGRMLWFDASPLAATTDKTGTLTTNVMTVTQGFTVDSDSFHIRSLSNISEAQSKLFLIGNLCNRAFANPEGVMVGQATEVALMNVLKAVGMLDMRPVRSLHLSVLTCRLP